MSTHLKAIFEGVGYEQSLRLFCDERMTFSGIADDLVTSVNEELQIYLNFSKKKRFLHSLRLSGEFIVLVPKVANVDIASYQRMAYGCSLLWPLSHLVNLWKQLRYDPQELKEIKPSTSNELSLVWLLSSGYYSLPSFDFTEVVNSVTRNILAEDPDGSPTVKEILYQLHTGEVVLKNITALSEKDTRGVTVYLEELDGPTIEWKSILLNREYCLIGNAFAVKIS
jgi:hypothetical protein